MKGKRKPTKRMITSTPPKINPNKNGLAPLNIKFNITHDNLSCFMGNKNNLKKVQRHTSKSVRHQKKTSSKTPVFKQSQVLSNNKQRKIETSPDIVTELSNTILSHIENQGIKCSWADNEEKLHKDESNENENECLWTVFSNQYEKSYASTNDFPYYQTMSFYPMENERMKSKSSYCSNVFTVLLQNIGNDPRTTIMIRNIPNKYTIDDLSREIDIEHANTYDFLYLPCDLKNLCNVGYGFINFTNTQNLKYFYHKFQNYVWKKFKSQKICALTYARLQGLTQLIEHFENSKVFRDKKYRPIIKYDKVHQIVLAQQAQQTHNF